MVRVRDMVRIRISSTVTVALVRRQNEDIDKAKTDLRWKKRLFQTIGALVDLRM